MKAVNSEQLIVHTKEPKTKALCSVIPACRESFSQKDAGQAGMTKVI